MTDLRNNFPFSKYWILLKRYLHPHKWSVVLLSVFMLCNIFLQILNPQVLRYYIDTFDLLDNGLISLSSANYRLLEAVVLYISIAIVQQICFVISIYISQNLAWKTTNKLRLDLANHCINLDMSFHNDKIPGKMIERVDGDITTLSNFFSQFSILVLSNVVLIIGILIVLFLEDVIIGLVFTVFTIITIGLLSIIWNYASPYWKVVRQTNADLFGFIEESISGREDVISLSATPYVMQRFHDYCKKNYDSTITAISVSRLIHVTVMGIIALGATLVFVVGIPLHERGVVSIGTIFLINSYVTLLFQPIIQIVRQSQELTQSDAAIDRINELFRESKKLKDGNKHFVISSKSPSLDFNDVSFGYSEDELVLRNITFNLEPGKKLGLIGRTGSGKTTITRLLFRLYDPITGNIQFDGVSLNSVPLTTLRSRIVYVTQKVELFHASLRDNITFFDRTVSDEQILKIISEVGLQCWYDRLSKGLDTVMLSAECGLSAGEAQLLAFTRAFIKNPDLVVLDEASSRLDPLTEASIERAIDRLLRNRTAIIIAHRLKTLDRVTDILHLEKGQVVEYGTREELTTNPDSRFCKLLKTGFSEVLE